MITSLSCIFTFAVLSGTLADDQTTERQASGTAVVQASIRRLQQSCIFPNDFEFLRRIAWHETRDGASFRLQDLTVRSGLWGTDKFILQAVQNDTVDRNLTAIKQQLADPQFNVSVTIDDFQWEAKDMEYPINSAAVARARLYAINETVPLTLKEQADFWATHYHDSMRDPNEFRESMKNLTECGKRGVDLMFLVDDSGSIGPTSFEQARKFVRNVIDGLDLGDDATRVGIMEFSDEAVLITTFTGDRQTLAQKTTPTGMPYNEGGTETGSALRRATQEFESNGRPASMGFPKATVLITDGAPNDEGDAVAAAKEMTSAGITLFTVGIGGVIRANLQEISSNPKCLHFYLLDAYDTLAKEFPDVLLSTFCTVAASVPPDVQQVNSTVSQGQSAFFSLRANVSEGVTLKVSTEVGETTLYASMTNRMPSSADYKFMANAPQGTTGQIFISSEELEKALTPSNGIDVYTLADVPDEEQGEVVPVFAAVYGESARSNFTLHVDSGNAIVTTTTTTQATTVTTTTLQTTTKAGESAYNLGSHASTILLWLNAIFVLFDFI